MENSCGGSGCGQQRHSAWWPRARDSSDTDLGDGSVREDGTYDDHTGRCQGEASFYTIDFSGPKPLIEKKKVVLKNDYIHHVVDIYHV